MFRCQSQLSIVGYNIFPNDDVLNLKETWKVKTPLSKQNSRHNQFYL